MANANPKDAPNNTADPLTRLQETMARDMKAVNAMIVARMDSPVPLIPQLAGYLTAAGGKRIRPLLTLAATTLYSGDMSRAHRLATAVEFIHTATLLHDDVVDESDTRRGQDSANEIFGNTASVLVGDFLFARAFQLMTEDGSLDVLRILSSAAAVIAEGEVLQLTTQGNITASMDDYLDVIKGKTAALFAAACEVGPVIAEADKSAAAALCEYGLNLGMAFQIADDVLDYTGGTQAQRGKAIGDDFREGKMTAPIILALEQAGTEEKDFWTRTMEEKNQQTGDLDRALNLLNKHRALTKGEEMARTYADKARLALAEAPDGPLRALLDSLAEFAAVRAY